MRRFHLASVILLASLAGGGCKERDEPAETRVLIGGDVQFGEAYEFGPSRSGPSVPERLGYDHASQGLKRILARPSYTIVNLETPLSLPMEADKNKAYVHWSDPAKAVPALRAMGVDAVGLANNHSMDQGAPSLATTMSSVAKADILSFGAGVTAREAALPLIHKMVLPGGKTRTMAVFGMFEYRPEYDANYRFYAKQSKPGVAVININGFARSVSATREQYDKPFVVAFPHWGRNYAWRTAEQQAQGRALIDAGADIVIGQHGHSLQEIERYRGKWIIYGIGNFMFNARGRFGKFRILPYGAAVELSFTQAAVPEVRLFPIFSNNRLTNFQPHPVGRAEAARVLAALRGRPASIGLAARVVQYPEGAAIVLAR